MPALSASDTGTLRPDAGSRNVPPSRSKSPRRSASEMLIAPVAGLKARTARLNITHGLHWMRHAFGSTGYKNPETQRV